MRPLRAQARADAAALVLLGVVVAVTSLLAS